MPRSFFTKIRIKHSFYRVTLLECRVNHPLPPFWESWLPFLETTIKVPVVCALMSLCFCFYYLKLMVLVLFISTIGYIVRSKSVCIHCALNKHPTHSQSPWCVSSSVTLAGHSSKNDMYTGRPKKLVKQNFKVHAFLWYCRQNTLILLSAKSYVLPQEEIWTCDVDTSIKTWHHDEGGELGCLWQDCVRLCWRFTGG